MYIYYMEYQQQTRDLTKKQYDLNDLDTLDNLNSSNIELGNVYLTYNKKSVIRNIPIQCNNKNYYFRIRNLNPESIRLIYKNNIPLLVFNNNQDCYNDYISKLSEFKQKLINKIVCIMNVPDIDNKNKDKIYFNLNISKHNNRDKTNINNDVNNDVNNKVNNNIQFNNIIEYENNKCNLDEYNLNYILKNCQYDIMVQAITLVLTDYNTYIKYRISRIYPKNINELSNTKYFSEYNKINIMNSLYASTITNMENINKLNNPIIDPPKYVNKKQIQNELKKICC